MVEVKLLFVCGINVEDDVDSSRKAWGRFFAIDLSIGTSTIHKAYELRWSIEVYFKKAKQNLEFLKEQRINFVSHTASILRCVSSHHNASGSHAHRKIIREKSSVGLSHDGT